MGRTPPLRRRVARLTVLDALWVLPFIW
jgi:hypothetical protein